MGHDNNGSNTGVLELAASPRTESRNTARLIAYLDKLADVDPAPVRTTEKVLALVALFLLMAWIDGGSLAAQIVQERHQQIERGCIAQYAASERWIKRKPMSCAPMVEAPNHLMSFPLAENK